MADWTFPQPYTDRKALADHMPVHVAHVRSIVPHEKLLEFHPRDGWAPLCQFPGKDIPVNHPFPYVNKGGNAANIIKIAIMIRLVKVASPYLGGAGCSMDCLDMGYVILVAMIALQ